MEKNKGRRNHTVTVSKRLARHSFILLKPKCVYNSESVARTIALCKGVKEVCLTSGSYAFVVATKHGSGNSIRCVCNRVKKITGSSDGISVAMNHYVYKQK